MCMEPHFFGGGTILYHFWWRIVDAFSCWALPRHFALETALNETRPIRQMYRGSGLHPRSERSPLASPAFFSDVHICTQKIETMWIAAPDAIFAAGSRRGDLPATKADKRQAFSCTATEVDSPDVWPIRPSLR
jgi:hypothetical protein